MTINCAERGLLLLRVRDEIHMTIAAYQTMYESSIAFGMRKALIAEQRKAEMEAKVSQTLYQVYTKSAGCCSGGRVYTKNMYRGTHRSTYMQHYNSYDLLPLYSRSLEETVRVIV